MSQARLCKKKKIAEDPSLLFRDRRRGTPLLGLAGVGPGWGSFKINVRKSGTDCVEDFFHVPKCESYTIVILLFGSSPSITM